MPTLKLQECDFALLKAIREITTAHYGHEVFFLHMTVETEDRRAGRDVPANPEDPNYTPWYFPPYAVFSGALTEQPRLAEVAKTDWVGFCAEIYLQYRTSGCYPARAKLGLKRWEGEYIFYIVNWGYEDYPSKEVKIVVEIDESNNDRPQHIHRGT